MRKFSCTALLFFALILSCFTPNSHALDDTYDVYLFCLEDAGDYCDANELVKDDFKFDDGDFTTEWFDDQLWGFNDPGEYADTGLYFTGNYEVYNEAAEKYDLDFMGISLSNNIILGSMTIKYYEWDFLKFKFEKEDDATAYFLGISK